ncbi:hypothetical protein JH06_4915 [Blastocystis sp. subtype 4]|uniref:hypothetical protein n=1 Tax=Blastocystis sp. subtype 4 TaxID=944170 RepID=UPI0007112BFD|nr:hypothetical protein JH06_4915 [Blastocystis sp. subtype 4]KNB42018.1 hypothetical protein JH06_4915 [Blastocystis sp. subtype 4]|eukprot:XP_014525461.1 hypothetical protein JH06_4915 [Blastocystis sp. subtype 4]
MAASFLFLTILSLALSLPAKNAPFTVDSYFVGSWAISSSVVPSNGGEIVENSEKYMYNITKTEDNVLAINYVDIATNMIVEKSSLVCELQSNTSCVMKHSSEDAQMMTISFQPIASKDVYISFGVDPHNAEASYEISTVLAKGSESMTVYTAERIIVAPQLTFFQKYGNLILMGVMMVVQVNIVFATTKMRMNQQQPAEEGEEKKEESDKPKSEYPVFIKHIRI